MDRLSSLAVGAPEGFKRKKGEYVVEIRDERTMQSIVITHDEPLAGYHLDVAEANWGDENHPDGVVVGELGGEAWVCFIEMKGTMKAKEDKADPAEKALEQLAGGVLHFHPEGMGTPNASHGGTHHNAWADGSDPLDVRPSKNHRVIGIAVGFRQVPRPPPMRPLKIGPTRVSLRVVQISSNERNSVRLSFKDLLKHAGHL